MAATAADRMVECLLEWGVDTDLWPAGRRHQRHHGSAADSARTAFRFLQVRHEEAAAFMACGYAKYTGQLGVCLATSGPGGDTSAEWVVRRENGRRTRFWRSPVQTQFQTI